MQTERALKIADGAATSARVAAAVASEPSRHGGKTRALRPICVDLDGTLVNTDTLYEGVLAILANPTKWHHLPSLLAGSRAAFKRQVARHGALDPSLLPYNKDVVAYLRERRAAGHPIVLATAADSAVAKSIADHLGLFDEVIASDGHRNLKGANKAAALVERFGKNGFDYIGNDASDLAVWREAAGILIAHASPSVKRRAARLGPVQATFDDRTNSLAAILRELRPHQWSKNVLVFVPLLAAHAWADPHAWFAALAVLASFCATASAIYIVNDLFDLSADRRHPRKRNRPLASGAVSIPVAVALSLALIAAGLVLGGIAGALPVVITYAVVSLSYSMALKRFPLVDVFVLAGLYTLRVLGGAVATGYEASPWLLGFSGFTFLSLALVKRSKELIAVEHSASRDVSGSRRGYQPGDGHMLQMFGSSAAFAASVVLALFVGSSSALQQYHSPEVLWAIVPLTLFWHCRLWLATNRGYMHDDPIVYATRDWVSWLVAASVVVVILTASSGIVSLS